MADKTGNGNTELGEFGLIARYFAPLAGPEGLGLLDDAACIEPSPGADLIVTKDMLLEGVHFLKDDPADSLARKALAVNLSDLAAKGARPRHYWLGLALPRGIPDGWLASFASGLRAVQEASGIMLQGGDTTASLSGIVISVTAVGDVPSGGMLWRSGAKRGDDIYVTGTLGDSALGLRCLQGQLEHDDDLVSRYRLPHPRLSVGAGLLGLAHASADISDGLIADLGHIAEASGLGADVEEALLPLSHAAQKAVIRDGGLWPLVWSGGDDYELVFTAAPDKRADVQALAEATAVPIHRVGRMSEKKGVRLVDPEGRLVQIAHEGYRHF